MPRLAQFFIALVVCLGLAGLAPTASNATDFVVIDSTDGAVKVGDMISGSQPVKVAAGAEVVLISESGERKVLKGPFSGAPGGGAGGGGGGGKQASVVSALSKLIAGRSASTNFVGATRAVGVKASKNQFAIEPARAADHCAPPGKGPELRRKPSRKSK